MSNLTSSIPLGGTVPGFRKRVGRMMATTLAIAVALWVMFTVAASLHWEYTHGSSWGWVDAYGHLVLNLAGSRRN